MFDLLPTRLLAAFVLPMAISAAPVGVNTGFENGLTGWMHNNVAVESIEAFEGSKRLNLQNGYISQTFSGLVAGQVHNSGSRTSGSAQMGHSGTHG